MTTNLQQGTLLDVLKKKMRATKEEMEKYKDECEEYVKKLQVEGIRREEVSLRFSLNVPPFHAHNIHPLGDTFQSNRTHTVVV